MADWNARAREVAELEPRCFVTRFKATPQPAHRRQLLRARYRYQRAEWAKHILPERFGRPWNPMQRALLGREVEPWTRRTSPTYEAYAAPRGGAKSTIGCFAEVVHAILYGLEKFVAVVSAEERLAKSRTKDLYRLFERPPPLLERTYGPFEIKGGWLDFEVRVRGGDWVRVWARSFGGQIRGELYQGARPTLFVIDDGERPDRVKNPDLRRDWMTYLQDDILEAGDSYTRYILLGTVLHRESGLAQLLRSPAWTSRRWQAVESWPERMDLWERCGQLWQDLALGGHRKKAAAAFYQSHRAEMEAGVRVLDPVAWPIYRCFEAIWTKGWRSFLRERQNDPTDPAAQLFDSGRFARCKVRRDPVRGWIIEAVGGREVPLSECRTLIRWDPSKGLPDGDFACLAFLARDRWGYTYVLDVWLRRLPPSAQLLALWAMAERWGCGRCSLESNGFQDLVVQDLPRQRAGRRQAGQFWQLQVTEEASTDDKEGRISTLEASATAGWLQFAEGLPPEVLRQFDDFPNGDHDDAPDAAHGAWVRLGGAPVKMGQERFQ